MDLNPWLKSLVLEGGDGNGSETRWHMRLLPDHLVTTSHDQNHANDWQ